MKTHNICPACKAILAFDRAALCMVKCPKCAYTGKVSDFKELTLASNAKEPVLDTELNTLTYKLYKPGKLELMESDTQWLQKERIVNLLYGINTLGRQSPDSTATVQLPTTDTFIGRVHATIEIIMKADGVCEHLLSDNESKNGTFHNGERLEKDDIIKLLPNDIIKMGHTYFKLISE